MSGVAYLLLDGVNVTVTFKDEGAGWQFVGWVRDAKPLALRPTDAERARLFEDTASAVGYFREQYAGRLR